MFELINKRSFYRNIHLNAPLLDERLQYLQLLQEHGNSLSTIKDAANYLLRIIELLPLKTKRVVAEQEIEVAADIWAKYQSNHPQKRQSFSNNSKERFIAYAFEWLKLIDCLKKPSNDVAIIYKIFERRFALKRHLTAPLLKERIKYLQYWNDSGASMHFLRVTAQYLLRVIEYTNLKYKCTTITIDEIKEAANKWARCQTKNRKNSYLDFSRKHFTGHACRWLKMLGYLKLPAKKQQPFSIYLHEYIDHIRHEQGFSEETIHSRKPLLENFLHLVWRKTQHFKKLTILIIDEIFFLKKNTSNYTRRSMQNYVSIIRAFLRYAEQKTWCENGLANAIKTARTYKHETLPYSPSWDDVKKIIAGTYGDNPTNIRDRAILLLLSVYGLRRIEVVKLTLDDIDWQKEQIQFHRAKGGKTQQFPLSTTVGEAILRYIKEVRANCYSYRNIFLNRRAPICPLSAKAITAIVNRRWKPLGVEIKHHGSHALRHACATHLINEGTSLKEISNHLGHSDMEATRIYAKVDLVNLRKVADFDFGDLL